MSIKLPFGHIQRHRRTVCLVPVERWVVGTVLVVVLPLPLALPLALALLAWALANGVAALAANVACLMLLAKHRKGEVHLRASWIFSKNDVIANVGVILGLVFVGLEVKNSQDDVIGVLQLLNAQDASGEVIEFTDPVIEKRQKEIAAEHGFELVDHSLVLYVNKSK